AEAGAIGERPNVLIASGEEPPAVLLDVPSVTGDRVRPLLSRLRRVVRRVDAHREDAEILPRHKRHVAEGANEVVEDEVAEDRASKIDEREHRGLAVERIAQPDELAIVTDELGL